MENKELIIQIPEGYEIDREQSTFEKIIFKRKKDLIYENIYKELFEDKPLYFITAAGIIGKIIGSDDKNPNSAPTKNQLERLLALNKLMNVAYYLNNGWEPTWDNDEQKKYYIYYYKPLNKFKIEFCSFFNCGRVYFKSKEIAEKAIQILGENVLKTIFGI